MRTIDPADAASGEVAPLPNQLMQIRQLQLPNENNVILWSFAKSAKLMTVAALAFESSTVVVQQKAHCSQRRKRSLTD
jgi:hypothetical protein